MELHIILIVLTAALLHASWNSMIKGGKNPLLDSMMISLVWIVISVIIIPLLPFPDPKSWPLIIVTVLIHVGYFFLLAKSYHKGEFSRVYPIVRGLPPLIVSIASFLILGENMSFYGWLGIAAISCGILTLEIGSKISSPRVFFLSLATAIMIAAYTFIDGVGARVSGNSTSFLMWLSLFQSIIFITLVVAINGKKQCLNHALNHWKKGIFSGLISISAYSIVLWAMTKAPIAQVSAIRETSVLFGSIIAITFLSEPLRISRIISAIMITIGIVMVKIG